jgi:hypothetical protein
MNKIRKGSSKRLSKQHPGLAGRMYKGIISISSRRLRTIKHDYWVIVEEVGESGKPVHLPEGIL